MNNGTKPEKPRPVTQILPIIWLGLLVSAGIAFFIAQVPLLGITLLFALMLMFAFHRLLLYKLDPDFYGDPRKDTRR